MVHQILAQFAAGQQADTAVASALPATPSSSASFNPGLPAMSSGLASSSSLLGQPLPRAQPLPAAQPQVQMTPGSTLVGPKTALTMRPQQFGFHAPGHRSDTVDDNSGSRLVGYQAVQNSQKRDQLAIQMVQPSHAGCLPPSLQPPQPMTTTRQLMGPGRRRGSNLNSPAPLELFLLKWVIKEYFYPTLSDVGKDKPQDGRHRNAG
jgi:hypothetical protein